MSIGTQITKIREAHKLTQEKFAGEIGVSRQAVQKWEAGTSQPDLKSVITIAKRFQVSADALLLGTDERSLGELRYDRKFQPQYDSINPGEAFSQELMQEYIQSMDEGRDMERYEGLFREVSKLPAGAHKEAISDVLFRMTLEAPVREGYPYYEPSELDEIRRSRPAVEERVFQRPGKEEMRRKLQGAWQGRIAGCLLGKPVEGISEEELRKLLHMSGNFPMRRYIHSTDITEEMIQNISYRLVGNCWSDAVTCAPADDDTNYTVLASELVERYGRDFTPYDVSRMWLAMQPKDAYFTAERVAFINFINGYLPPQSAIYKNVYREWIGAQIRGDYFGYINPGEPEKAAEMAWRDASISHVKNGIYGEMFVAAMLAAAACVDDIEEIIQIGLQEIPARCRLREAVLKLIAEKHRGASYDCVIRDIHDRWDSVPGSWVHTISNAEIVTAALLYGDGDFGKSICLAVQAAYDTDCNGATVGSIIGMAKGISAIPTEWTAPINGTLRTSLFGMESVSVTEMVDRTLEQAGY